MRVLSAANHEPFSIAAWYKVGRDKTAVAVNFDSWTKDTFGNEYTYAKEGYGLINEHIDVRHEHANLIRYVGAASTVLLKNINNALPLTGREKYTAVFGYDAGGNPYGPNGCDNRGCDNGTLAMGWVSNVLARHLLFFPITSVKRHLASYGMLSCSVRNISDPFLKYH